MALAALVALVPGGCDRGRSAPPQTAPRQDASRVTKSEAAEASDMRIHELEAELAALEAEPERPGAGFHIINGHEHLMAPKYLRRYLPAARKAGIVATVMVASPDFTLYGKGPKGEPGMEKNFLKILEAAKQYPGEIIPFIAIDPDDPDKLERAKRLVAMGAKGVKMYSGHSVFYSKRLDAPDMEPVYAWLEETGLPFCWHVNLLRYLDQFEAVMEAHPYLNVQVPHYGVTFWRPDSPAVERLKAMLRKYPNMYIDTSLGTRKILVDGLKVMSDRREVFLEFFREFPDRITFGTDGVVTGNREKTTRWWYRVIMACRGQLEQDGFHFALAEGYSRYFHKGLDPTGYYRGLGLPREVLQKIYEENPKRWLSGPRVRKPGSN